MCISAVASRPSQIQTQSLSCATSGQGVIAAYAASLGGCSCGSCGQSQCACCSGGVSQSQGPGGSLQTGGHHGSGAHACSVGMQGCDAVHCKYADDGSPVTPGAPWNDQPGGNLQTGVHQGGGAHACSVGMQGCDAVHCKYASDGSPVTPGAPWNQQSGGSQPNVGGGGPAGFSQGGGCRNELAELVMLLYAMLSGGGSQGAGGPFFGSQSPFGQQTFI